MQTDKPVTITLGRVSSRGSLFSMLYHSEGGQHDMWMLISEGRRSIMFQISDESVHMIKDLISEYEKCAAAGKAALQGLSENSQEESL